MPRIDDLAPNFDTLQLLGVELANFRTQIQTAYDQLTKENPGVDPNRIRDTTGRFILADMGATYALLLTSWINLRRELAR